MIAGAIRYAFCSGVKGIFTAHGDSFEEICSNLELENLLKSNMIEKIIFLDNKIKGKIKMVYELDKKTAKWRQWGRAFLMSAGTGFFDVSGDGLF